MCFTVQLSRFVPFGTFVPASAATRLFYHNVLCLSRTFLKTFFAAVRHLSVVLCELLYLTTVFFICQQLFSDLFSQHLLLPKNSVAAIRLPFSGKARICVCLSDSFITIPLLPAFVNAFFEFFYIFFKKRKSVQNRRTGKPFRQFCTDRSFVSFFRTLRAENAESDCCGTGTKGRSLP